MKKQNRKLGNGNGNGFERELRRNKNKKVFKITLEHSNFTTGAAKYIAAETLEDAKLLAKKYAKNSYDFVGNCFAVTVREIADKIVFEGTLSDVVNNKGTSVAVEKIFATNIAGDIFPKEIKVFTMEEEGVFVKRIHPLPILNLKGAYVDTYAQSFRSKI